MGVGASLVVDQLYLTSTDPNSGKFSVSGDFKWIGGFGFVKGKVLAPANQYRH